jgi:SAM-dependent methyltransferase
MGILGPLSTRVGLSGSVVGIDKDEQQLTATHAYVADVKLQNVEVIAADAYDTGLQSGSFGFVNTRFLFAPAGRDDVLLAEMHRLVKPGGYIGIQEPDSSSWTCYSPSAQWDRLKAAILQAFRAGGGDFDAGKRTRSMLKQLGYGGVAIRAAVLALSDRHPYMRLPVQFATSLRARILGGRLLDERDLNDAMAECERIAGQPDAVMISFVVTQVSGRKPE